MTSSKVKIDTLKFILQAGQVRVKSLSLFVFIRLSDRANAYRLINRLIDEGLIEKKSYKIKPTGNHRSESEDVYHLTQKGKLYTADSSSDLYFNQNYQSFEKRFALRSGDDIPQITERIEKALTENDFLAMLSAWGIPVFEHEKPSLKYLEKILTGKVSEKAPGYLDNLDSNTCKELLDAGIYYSASEFTSFAESKSLDISDTISGTRARGILITDKSCFVIYTPAKYDNRILRVNLKGEQGLINALNRLSSFTHIYRPVPAFDDVIFDDEGKRAVKTVYENLPYALIMSDGDMLAYSVATGHAKGKVKYQNAARLTEKIESNARLLTAKEAAKASTYLTAASSLYKRLYVVPETENGSFSLKYLIDHSIEDERDDGIDILKKDSCFTYDASSVSVYPYYDISSGYKRPVCYMPVIEGKTLYKIAAGEDNPVIITYEDLLNILARSIRKEGCYYNADTSEHFDKDAVLIYDAAGHIKGEHMLELALKEEGLCFNKRTEGTRLAALFNLPLITFYNKIARDEIKLDDVLPLIETKEDTSGKAVKSRYVTISCSLKTSLKNQLKKEAELKNSTVSRVISDALTEYFNKT